MDDISTCWCRVSCSHQMWMHQGMQKSEQVQKGRLDVHNVVQLWWMLIRRLVHVAYGRVKFQCIDNLMCIACLLNVILHSLSVIN